MTSVLYRTVLLKKYISSFDVIRQRLQKPIYGNSYHFFSEKAKEPTTIVIEPIEWAKIFLCILTGTSIGCYGAVKFNQMILDWYNKQDPVKESSRSVDD